MQFGSLLKAVLALNDIKMYNLADALGYDKSYISKWINNAKLPPAKSIDALSEQIAAFVAGECSDERKRMTAREFGFAQKNGEPPEDPVFIRELAAVFRRTYWRTRYASEREDPGSNHVVPAARSDAAECILFTQPISKTGAFQSALDDLQGLDTENERFSLTAVIDPVRFGEHVDLYWKHICRLLRLPNVELVDLWDAPRDLPDRLAIAKHAFVEQSVPLPFSRQNVTMRVTDPATVDAYYEDACAFLRQQQVLLESSNVNGNLYYYKYSTTDTKRYLLSSMFPMYMSEELFEEILEKYGSKTQSSAAARKRYLKEFNTKKSVVIYDTALLRYMSTGKLSAFDAYEGETLTKDERKRHLQGLIDEMEDGQRLELKILSDKNPILNYNDISVSFFMNGSSAYCSDIRKKTAGVRYFVSSECRKHLSTFLDHIHALPGSYLTGQQRAIDYIYYGMKNM